MMVLCHYRAAMRQWRNRAALALHSEEYQVAFKPKKEPEEVFTPRAAEINERMYVTRPRLEESLTDALKSNKYIVIHGESGNGKTWLYRKVFKSEKVHFETLNLANAIGAGSLSAAMREKLGELGISQAETQASTVSGGFKPSGIGVEASSTETARIAAKGALVSLLGAIREKAGSRRAVLVLDNFEQITDRDDILREIAALIISADEEAVAKHNVKVLIVGVPGDIKVLISKNTNESTISNRLTEIPEVARMTTEEATTLMKKGLQTEIGLSMEIDEEPFYRELSWKSDRIAQHIHEICLKVANEAVRAGGVINDSVVAKAESKWLDDSLSSDWAVIEGHMNARDTRAGRRNQVIYAIGRCDKEEFKYSDIEAIVRSEFPVTTNGVVLNSAQALTTLGEGPNPLLRRTPKGDAYRFVSPKLRMAIRAGLKKGDDEKVEKSISTPLNF
jgi:Cdc6-like AAA superfamily ATPase